MSNNVVVAVRDSKAEVFGTPFFVQTGPAGIRSFASECNRASPDNILFTHTEDFDLYDLGHYDHETAKFTPCPEPRLLCPGSAIVKDRLAAAERSAKAQMTTRPASRL